MKRTANDRISTGSLANRRESRKPEHPSLSRLALHTITTRPWSLSTALDTYASKGIGGISIWRTALESKDKQYLRSIHRQMKDAGITGVSLVRGGFFASADKEKRVLSLEENRRTIIEAEALGIPKIVVVCGADPAQSLQTSRDQITEALQTLAPEAHNAGVRLLVEPLHPMYADNRSAISTLGQANDLCQTVNHSAIGVAIDVYHTWWDPNLKDEIDRCGIGGWLDAFHVCDWKTPTDDFLNDRGLMGEGCIDIPGIRSNVEAAGFAGFIEVEIFSEHYWSQNQDDYLEQIIEAFRRFV